MGVAPGLQGQPGCQTVVVLPQGDPGLGRQGDELAPGFLIQPRVGRVRDVLFHHRGVDGDAGQAGVVDRP